MRHPSRAYRVHREGAGETSSAETYEIWTPRMAARRYTTEFLDEGEAATLIVESRCTFSEKKWRAWACKDFSAYDFVTRMEAA